MTARNRYKREAQLFTLSIAVVAQGSLACDVGETRTQPVADNAMAVELRGEESLTQDVFADEDDDSDSLSRSSLSALETTNDQRDILDRLNSVRGLVANEQECPVEGARCINLIYRQPLDHRHPWDKHFEQAMSLVYRGADAPTVLYPEGYYLAAFVESEPAQLLKANELAVEHRFYPPAVHERDEWSKLTIRQSAADIHRIVRKLKPMLAGSWISTGYGGSGMAAIYHRRFYPHDVDGTIAYVAPDSRGAQDPRFGRFLSRVGPESCRQAFVALQREALTRREELVPIIEQRAIDRGFTFDRLEGGADEALEIVVSQAWSALWQYAGVEACDQLPALNSPAFELFTYFTDTFALANIADASIEAYLPYYYQAGTELGFGDLWTQPFEDLLRYNPSGIAGSMPEGFEVDVDKHVMRDISHWVKTRATDLMLIYGENDPYTSLAFRLPQSHRRQTSTFVAPQGNHQTRLKHLTAADKDQAYRTLEAWTGKHIDLSASE